MDDTLGRQFFAQPINPFHRRYEAVRAVILDGRPQKEVAEQFGYQPSTLRQLVYEFRQFCRSEHSPDHSPFFRNPNSDDRPNGGPAHQGPAHQPNRRRSSCPPSPIVRNYS